MGRLIIEFKHLKIGQSYFHGNILFTKKDNSHGVTISGIPFFMNDYDIVEPYNEDENNDTH